MRKASRDYPLDKKALIENFGFLCFQTALVNIEVVGVSIIKNNEVVVIAFRGGHKVGFIYEGEKLTPQQVFRVFSDVPATWDQLERWEDSMNGKIELLYPPKENYVFINDKEVQEATKENIKKLNKKLKNRNISK